MLHYPDPGQTDDRIIEDWQIEGITDAALGCAPEYPDNSAYMNGWVQEVVRRVKAGETMQVRWLSYAYVTGGYDAPDYIGRNEDAA